MGSSTGTFQPAGSLAAFNDLDAAGTWTLEISDNAKGDSGTLIAGPKKTLKTNISIDLAISLSHAGLFLGRLPARRTRGRSTSANRTS